MKNPTLKDAALELLIELEGSRLDVVLIPSHDPDCAMRGGKIRAAHESNCEWYQKFCKSFSSTRRRKNRLFDTMIKRQHTIKALERIMKGEARGVYTSRLMPLVEEKLKEMRGYRVRSVRPAKHIESSYAYF